MQSFKFRDFCEQTSLHGWNFFPYTEFKKWHVTFWTFVLCGTFTCCSIMIYLNSSEYMDATVAFNIESPTNPLNEVYYPAIIICNKNVVRKSIGLELVAYEKSTITLDQFFDYLEYKWIDKSDDTLVVDDTISEIWQKALEKVFERFIEQNSDSTGGITTNTDFYHWHTLNELPKENLVHNSTVFWKYFFPNLISHTQLEDFLLNLDFNGAGVLHYGGYLADNKLPRNRFTPFYKKPKDLQDIKSYVPYARSGSDNGITFLLDAETYDYAVCPSNSAGFVMGVQHHLDIEQTQNYGNNIHPGEEVFIGVSIALTTTHPGVRTRFYPRERDCYFQDEIQLKHLSDKFYRYSMGNCLTEAYLQHTEKICNCTKRVAHKQSNANYTYCIGKTYFIEAQDPQCSQLGINCQFRAIMPHDYSLESNFFFQNLLLCQEGQIHMSKMIRN